MLAVGGGSAVPDLVGTWPLVGRAVELERAMELLRAPSMRSVLLAGPAGVGKSRLLGDLLVRLERSDVAVAHVCATRSASSIPFGALAPLLPVDDLLADSIVGVLQRAAKAIASRGRGREVVLAVDDAHLLDDASATLVHQLALDGTVRVLLAVRTGERLTASLAGVAADSSTATIELNDLGRIDVAELAASVLGGEVDGAVVQRLWDESRGNPLYVRELLVASTEDGAIHREAGVWRSTGRPSVPTRLVELVEARLAASTDDERIAIELLAVGHVLGRETLEAIVGTEVVSGLLQRGVVHVARDARRQPVRLHHPLYEETVRRRMSARRLRAVQLRLADIIAAAGMRRRPDRLLVTTLRLDAGGRLDADLIEAAAMDAYFALDIALSERLTRAAIAAGAGSRLRRILAEILRYQGRFEEAEAMLAAISVADVDERERTLTAIVRAENQFRGLGQHDAAVRTLREVIESVRDSSLRDEAAAMTAVITALSGDLRTALADATAIIDRGPSRAMSHASTAAVVAMTFMGRADDATSCAEHAFLVAGSLAPQESQAVVAIHLVERCLALVESGRLAECEALARISYDWSLAGGHQLGQAWFALLLGRAAQYGGRLEEATSRFRECALTFRDLRDHGIRRWALAGLAQVHATLGRSADAAIALDELDTAPPTAVHVLESEVLRARAWLMVARGANTQARRLLLDAADWANSRGQSGLELAMLHDLVRLGDARGAAARAMTLAPTVQGDLAAARRLHAAGARSRDGSVLDAATEAFADIGANLFAAEAAAHAANAHRRDGHLVAASASAARADELALRCDSAATPALGTSGSSAADQLTERELEIATLAARGRTSREIAMQLSISVRTVDNQLQRAYTKLGISGRRELAARLMQP